MDILKTPTLPNHTLGGTGGTGGMGDIYSIPIGAYGDTSLSAMSKLSSMSNPLGATYVDYQVKGKMVTATLQLSMDEHTTMHDGEIKSMLLAELLREVAKENCVEFTRQEDYARANPCVYVRARIFVTPNDNVQLIRKMQK